MPRSQIERIQDCIHGLMEFKETETVVIDVLRTAELQRLRRIRQMGLAHFVFPGAEHSRWTHSLGASYLAIRFGNRLREKAPSLIPEILCPSISSIRDLAVAALCHDLGHGPLSHAWEYEVVGKSFDVAKWSASLGISDEKENLKGAQWHELVTVSLLKWEQGELHKILEQHEAGFSLRLCWLLRKKYYIPYMARLLSSDIDIDRADYLLRDSKQCGVTYGNYDIERLLSTITLGYAAEDKIVFGFDERKAMRAVEQFLRARRDMYEIAYFHKTVRCAEAMAGLFLRRLKRLVQEGDKFEVPDFMNPFIKMIRGEYLSPDEILRLDDYSLWVFIDLISSKTRDPTLSDLGKRLLSRNLFKTVPCSRTKVSDFLQEPDSQQKLQDTIKSFCKGEKEFYVVSDTPSFEMFASQDKVEEWGYFINSKNAATPFRLHDEFRSFSAEAEKYPRIYTISEALDAVVRLIH